MRRLAGVAAFGAMSLLAAGASVAVGVGAAHAADGDVSPLKAYVVPATGTNDSVAKVQLPITSCPADAEGFAALMYGPGFPVEGQLIKGTGFLSEIADTGGLYQLQFSFVDTAGDAATPLIAGGVYRVNTFCQGAFSAPTGPSYDATFTVNSPGGSGTYTAETPPAPAADTTTTVTVPAGPVTVGSPVAVSAAITGNPSVGTVQFQDNGVDVGGPVNVTSGAASTSITLATAGTRSITAVYSGGTGFNASTSAAASLVVNPPPPAAVATTTALAVTPTTGVTTSTSLTLSATVSPAGAAGDVVFKRNGAAIGDPIPVTGGSATTAYTVPTPGNASITAEFVPTDPAAFLGSQTVGAISFLVTGDVVAPPPGADVQTVVVPVDPGSLVIDTPYTAADPLILDPLVLNSSATALSGSKPFQNILITDTRPGTNSWTASANASDLLGASDLINGQNVGLTGLVPAYVAGNALQDGDVTITDVAAANAVAPADPGSLGLKGAKVFATAPEGRGTVTLNGVLDVNAPTSTPAGTYTGTVTFTIA